MQSEEIKNKIKKNIWRNPYERWSVYQEDIYPQLVGKCAMKPATVSRRTVAFNRNTA